MSADELRRAASLMRDANTSRFDGHEDRFMLAVADWLTVTAWWIEDEWPDDPAMPMDWEASTGPTAERVKAALAVARAYLGADT